MFFESHGGHCGPRILVRFLFFGDGSPVGLCHRKQDTLVVPQFHGDQCSPVEIQIQSDEILLSVLTRVRQSVQGALLRFHVKSLFRPKNDIKTRTQVLHILIKNENPR